MPGCVLAQPGVCEPHPPSPEGPISPGQGSLRAQAQPAQPGGSHRSGHGPFSGEASAASPVTLTFPVLSAAAALGLSGQGLGGREGEAHWSVLFLGAPVRLPQGRPGSPVAQGHAVTLEGNNDLGVSREQWRADPT